MKSAELETSLQEARDILGLPLAQDPAPVFDIEPGSETKEGLCGGPIFMDTSAESYPVYTAAHGTEDWSPGLIVASFRYLVRILERLRVLARGRATSVQMNEHPLTEKEREASVDSNHRDGSDVDVTL